MTVREIARRLNVPKSSVSFSITRFREQRNEKIESDASKEDE